jgi:hypothetical protein
MVVLSGGYFATSLGLGGCFAAVVRLHLRRMLCRWGSWCCDEGCATFVLLGFYLQVLVLEVVWAPLVCGLWSVLFSPCCLLLCVLWLCFLAFVCVFSVFLCF